MRHWLFHPLVFYPLAIAFAAFVIGVSVRPQSWPRAAAAVAAQASEGALVFEGEAFNSPAYGPEQDIYVVRDFVGRPQALRIAQRPAQPELSPSEQGAQLLLTSEQAAQLANRALTIEVSYNALQVNAASELAIAVQGEGQSQWQRQATPPQPTTLRFELPAQNAVNAIALRAISAEQNQAYGLEITRVRVTPHP